MWQTVGGAVILLIAYALYYVLDLLEKRKELDGLPQPPMASRLFGHLNIAAECSQVFPEDANGHYWPDYIRTKYNLPEVFYMDWRPLGPKWLYIADPELAAQYATTTQCLPKSPLETDYLTKLLGSNNLVTLEGHNWKSLRPLFNPGFSFNNIIALAEFVVDSTLVFSTVMREKAASNELFEMEKYACRVTIDIMGKLILDTHINAQTGTHPISEAFWARSNMMPRADKPFWWQDIQLTRPYRMWQNERTLNRLVGAEVDRKIIGRARAHEWQEPGSHGTGFSNAVSGVKMSTTVTATRKQSVLDVVLDGLEKKMSRIGARVTHERDGNRDGDRDDKKPAASGPRTTSATFRFADPAEVPTQWKTDLVDNIKTFLFAGHDTSGTAICWTLYLLHNNPQAYAKLKAELDEVFPSSDPSDQYTTTQETAAKIKADPYVINKLEYLTAVIKETLRLFPPASTVRWIDPRDPLRSTYLQNIVNAKNKSTLAVDPSSSSSPSSSTSSSSSNSGPPVPVVSPSDYSSSSYSFPPSMPLTDSNRTVWATTHIYPTAHMIHRNTRFFPDPARFVPERHIPRLTPYPYPLSELHTPAGREAFRPFERGPRSCIGQELAMTELRIFLALVVREFDFVLEYAPEPPEAVNHLPVPQSVAAEFDPRSSDYGRKIWTEGCPAPQRNTVEGHRVYSVLRGSTKPKGGCPGRIYKRN